MHFTAHNTWLLWRFCDTVTYILALYLFNYCSEKSVTMVAEKQRICRPSKHYINDVHLKYKYKIH